MQGQWTFFKTLPQKNVSNECYFPGNFLLNHRRPHTTSHRLRRLEKLRLKVADLFKETIVGFFCQLLFFLRSGFKFEPHQILQTFLQSWDTAEHKLAFTYHHFHCSHLPKKTFIITCRSLESLSPRYCRRPSDSRRFLSVNLQLVTLP